MEEFAKIFGAVASSGILFKLFEWWIEAKRNRKQLAASRRADIGIKKPSVHLYIKAIRTCTTKAEAKEATLELFIALVNLFNAAENLAASVEAKGFRKQDITEVQAELSEMKGILFLAQDVIAKTSTRWELDADVFKFEARNFCIFFRVLEAEMNADEAEKFKQERNTRGLGVVS